MPVSENFKTERTRRLDDGSYASYDLVAAQPGDTLTIATASPNNRVNREVFDLIKLEVPEGTSALEGWAFATEMGQVTVRLLLLGQSKEGALTALHGRVVLRKGRVLGVSARISAGEGVTSNEAALSTYQNLGSIAAIADRLVAEEDLSELSLSDTQKILK